MKSIALIRNALFIFICLICALILAIGALAGIPRLFRIEACTVMSDSMNDSAPRGSLAYIDNGATGEDVSEGDIIAFSIGDRLCIHRALRVDKEGGIITTKGDANEIEDLHPVTFDDVKGIMRFAIPHVGALLDSIIANKVIMILASAAAAFAYLALAYLPLHSNEHDEKGKGWQHKKLNGPRRT